MLLEVDGGREDHDGEECPTQPRLCDGYRDETAICCQDAEDGSHTYDRTSSSTYLPVPKDEFSKQDVSTNSVSSLQSTLYKGATGALGRPKRRRMFSTLDMVAVTSTLICLVVAVVIIVPSISLAWRMGFQAQIIAIGFLLGVMNICANQVMPSCFVALEAYFGRSRLQNFDAIITSKFLSSDISNSWRAAIVLFLGLPLALSVGYKQFLGGRSSAALNPLDGSSQYGISFPNIGDWAPIQDPIYLEFSADAAFHYASSNDTTTILGSVTSYPVPYGINILLLSEDSAAVLDLPLNEYLQEIRSRLTNGETWQVTTSIDAYVAARDEQRAQSLRSDDAYWERTLNATDKGLASYWLSQDANTYVGLLAAVGEPSCWIGLFAGGPTTDSMYTKSLDSFNVFGFRKSAYLFSLSRRRCEATWTISASSLVLKGGVCANSTTVGISQEPVNGCASCPWTVNGGPDLPHIFAGFVLNRPNSTWLMPRYAVTTASVYWAKGVYMIQGNRFQGFNYSGRDERIVSTRDTLDAAPLLFVCLAVQPVLTIIAFVTIMLLSAPLSSNFGLIAVLAGVEKSSLHLLEGAAFSGQLKEPVKLEVHVMERAGSELGGMPVGAIKYELKPEGADRLRLSRADRNTLYL